MFGEPGQPEEASGEAPPSILRSRRARPASDAASLRDHRTALASNRSSNEYDDSRSDYSDDEENLSVAISAAPRKRAKRKVPSKKELTIAMSKPDYSTDDDAALAKLGKLAASYAAAPLVEKKRRRIKDPKGAQRDP